MTLPPNQLLNCGDLLLGTGKLLYYVNFNTLSVTVAVVFKCMITTYSFCSAPTSTYGSATEFPAIDPSVGLQKWYRLDTDTELSDNIFAERLAFWDSLQLSDTDFDNCYC